jgi:hypothetical protein
MPPACQDFPISNDRYEEQLIQACNSRLAWNDQNFSREDGFLCIEEEVFAPDEENCPRCEVSVSEEKISDISSFTLCFRVRWKSLKMMQLLGSTSDMLLF